MSDGRRRRPSIFGAIVLVAIGVIFLLHNFYGDFNGWEFLYHWWPVFLILAGVARLVDYEFERRSGSEGTGGSRSGGTQVVLIVFLVILIFGAIVAHHVRDYGGPDRMWPIMGLGQSYSFSEPSQAVPAPASPRVNVSTPNGDITVHTENSQQIRVEVMKSANAMSEHEA